MLTVIETILDIIAIILLGILVFSIAFSPENKFIRYVREHKILQVVLGIIILIGLF